MGVMVPVPTPARPLATVTELPRERRGDAELVAAIARGDRGALAEVWRAYAPSVRNALLGCLGADHAVDDLTQELFVSLLRTAGTMKNPSGLRSYLFGAAIRAARHERRTRGRRRRWLELWGREVDEHAPPPVAESRDSLRALERALQGLPERYREAFVLRHVESLPPDEVAAALGVSLATVKRDLARARDHLLIVAEREAALAAYLPTRTEEQR